jgi:hypothetical protein
MLSPLYYFPYTLNIMGRSYRLFFSINQNISRVTRGTLFKRSKVEGLWFECDVAVSESFILLYVGGSLFKTLLFYNSCLLKQRGQNVTFLFPLGVDVTPTKRLSLLHRQNVSLSLLFILYLFTFRIY